MKFPKHDAELYLVHNWHLGNYITVAQAIEDKDHGYGVEDWVNPEQMAKAIETNDCWYMQWYPHSPVGFRILVAADLDVLLEAALAAPDA